MLRGLGQSIRGHGPSRAKSLNSTRIGGYGLEAFMTAFLIVLGILVGILMAVVLPWALLRKLDDEDNGKEER